MHFINLIIFFSFIPISFLTDVLITMVHLWVLTVHQTFSSSRQQISKFPNCQNCLNFLYLYSWWKMCLSTNLHDATVSALPSYVVQCDRYTARNTFSDHSKVIGAYQPSSWWPSTSFGWKKKNYFVFVVVNI